MKCFLEYDIMTDSYQLYVCTDNRNFLIAGNIISQPVGEGEIHPVFLKIRNDHFSLFQALSNLFASELNIYPDKLAVAQSIAEERKSPIDYLKSLIDKLLPK